MPGTNCIARKAVAQRRALVPIFRNVAGKGLTLKVVPLVDIIAQIIAARNYKTKTHTVSN